MAALRRLNDRDEWSEELCSAAYETAEHPRYLVLEEQLAECLVAFLAHGSASFPRLRFPVAKAAMRGRLLLRYIG